MAPAISLSIITPTFRREAYLTEAIASVQKIDGLEWEMLIGDVFARSVGGAFCSAPQ